MFVLKIDVHNSAFDEDKRGEIARILEETADKIRLVGVLGQDDLNRHLAPHRGLVGAINGPEAPLTEAFFQFVSA